MGTTLDRGALLHKRYRIVEILGQGGMGSVYRAVDENLGVDVAVKENLFTSDEYTRQFRLEAVLLANLRHPNLPRVTDHFVIGEQGQYLIMDYIEGEDLRQRMERTNTVAEEEAILIGAAMCDALQYLHTRKPPIIHRDVKPGNVRITPDGHIYLVDFGLAKLAKGSQVTTTGARAMTPGYSPPEQYGTARTDPRTDIYSLGATLYAALTGIIPEDGLARAMDNVELTPLRKRNPRVSRKLAAAIEKAMAIRPEDRFQTADEFKKALTTTNVKTQRLEGEIIVEPPPPLEIIEEDKKPVKQELPSSKSASASRPPSGPAKKKRNWSTGCWVTFSFFLLAVLAIVLAVVYYWIPISQAFLAQEASPTSVPASVSVAIIPSASPTVSPTVESATATLTATREVTPTPTVKPSPTLLPSLTSSPTETLEPSPTVVGGGPGQIAFASSRSGIPEVYIMNTDGSQLRQVTYLPDGACQPAWSPDGSQIVFTSPCPKRQDDYPAAKLYVTNVDGNGLVELPSEGDGDFDPAWSPDGTRIAFTSLQSGRDQIYVLNLNDYGMMPLTDMSGDVHLPDWSRQPAWSPDGTQIVYTGHSRLTTTLQIWIMDEAGLTKTLLIPRGSEYWDFLPTWSSDGKTILFNETSGPQALGWLMTFDYEHRETAQATHLRAGTFANYGRYSPDGLWVVYDNIDITDPNSMDYDIYILRTAPGNAPIRLASDPAMDFDPAWQPAGSP